LEQVRSGHRHVVLDRDRPDELSVPTIIAKELFGTEISQEWASKKVIQNPVIGFIVL
jgi:hypothetical protein